MQEVVLAHDDLCHFRMADMHDFSSSPENLSLNFSQPVNAAKRSSVSSQAMAEQKPEFNYILPLPPPSRSHDQ